MFSRLRGNVLCINCVWSRYFLLSVGKHLGVTKLNQFVVLAHFDMFDTDKLAPFINENNFKVNKVIMVFVQHQ